MNYQYLALAVSFVTFISGIIALRQLLSIPVEKDRVLEISKLVREGLRVFNWRLISSVSQLMIYVFIAIYVFSKIADYPLIYSQILAFFLGCIVIILMGVFAFEFAPKVVPRVIRYSRDYKHVSLRFVWIVSSVLALILISLLSLGLIVSYLLLGPDSVIGLVAGVVLAAFFLRVGGGLFKAASDIGVDVGTRLEKGLTQNDPRNVGSFLDIIGDYVGNIIGFNSDLSGAYFFALISGFVFPLGLKNLGLVDIHSYSVLVQLPFFVMTISIISAVVALFFGVFRIQYKRYTNLLLEALYLSLLICGGGMMWFLGGLDFSILELPLKNNAPFVKLVEPYLIGLVGAVLIGFTSEYLTSNRFSPAKKVAAKTEYGTAMVMFQALSQSMKSNSLYLFYLVVVIFLASHFAGAYGVCMASLGMLSVTPTIFMIKLFSPLVSTVSSFANLAQSNDIVKRNLAVAQKIGGTTVALGNGFSMGASIMSTIGLFLSLITLGKVGIPHLFVFDQWLLVGITVGISMPFIFSGFLISGLSNVVLLILKEISRQFKEIPYLKEDKAKPDIRKAADYCARLCMDSLIIPGIIVALIPLAIGYFFGVKMLFGLVLGAFLIGFNQGFHWANLGDSLHHACQYVQDEHYGGKSSSVYTYIQSADNIGDAYKDLLKPGISMFIKSCTIVTVLMIYLLIQSY